MSNTMYRKIGHVPMIWVKKLGFSIPFIKNEAKSLQEHDKKIKNMGILEKIRSSHYGKPNFSDPAVTSSPVVQKVTEEKDVPEHKIEIVSKEQNEPIKISANSNKDRLHAPDENVTSPDKSFEENLEAISESILGIPKPVRAHIAPDKDGNFTKKEYDFDQNLDAVSLGEFGRGIGPKEVQHENITRKGASFEQNLNAVRFIMGDGDPETFEDDNKPITDPSKSFEENAEAIVAAHPNLRARQAGWKLKSESKKS